MSLRGPNRNSARREAASLGPRGGWITPVSVAVIVMLIGLVGAAFWFSQTEKAERIELNAADLCPKDTARNPPSVYVVLVDQTDPLEELARVSVANEVLQLLKSELEGESDVAAKRNARVEVWTFTAGAPNAANMYRVGNVQLVLAKSLSICNPGAPAKWDHLYRNVDVVRRQHARFYASLKDIVEQSLAFKEAPRSPIIEALFGIGAKVFTTPELAAAGKHLILVSDLVQGTQTVDFFQSGYKPDYPAWRRTTAGRQTLPELAKVDVTAIMIPGSRPDLQTEGLIGFWTKLFDAAGATPKFIKKP
ncbi:hypothetical protein SAMN02745126_06495 [Enhydrobacter aerosaccus]|uniref:Uncharacterized protein n=1 Tax=Enhydrobacter aerosaccus TaxID=225324 RepID=A0A1T4TLF7_9HYPH|nr:hypothetical protein [Enhydrobacter aerosaccus]SKA41353.1 hypothetical protein SAMN02745126_06495 [Enhydrobacter aerosaccus]